MHIQKCISVSQTEIMRDKVSLHFNFTDKASAIDHNRARIVHCVNRVSLDFMLNMRSVCNHDATILRLHAILAPPHMIKAGAYDH